MSAVTDIGIDSTSANPTASETVTTTGAVPAGAKVIVMNSLAITTPVANCQIDGVGMEPFIYMNRSTNIAIWGFYFDAWVGVRSGAAVKTTFTGTSGPGGTMAVCYATGIIDGPPDVVGTNQGGTNAVSSGASGTPPSTTADYFAFAAYGYLTATAGTTAANSYTGLTEVIQAARTIKLERAWSDFTHTVASKTETWTDTAANAGWTGGIALWQQGSFRVPLLDASKPKFVEMRPNI